MIPLGSTVNMDGTSLYQGVCVIFLAQLYGIDLTMGHYLKIVLVGVLASIGTAGIPGAGLMMLGLILSSVGMSLDGLAIIAGIDRILDMARTALNVTGNGVVSLVISESERKFSQKSQKKEEYTLAS